MRLEHVQPIDEAVKIVKEYNSSILFHSDAVQGFGKYHIYPKRQKIDLLSASGHKIHGPKGTGFLYVGEKVKIKPIRFRRRTTEGSPFGYRKCSGNCRAWTCNKDDL